MTAITPMPEKTHGPFGNSSTLTRYNASFAINVQRDINSFARALADHHHELVMEESDSVGEPSYPKIQIEQPTMECPRCFKRVKETQELLVHLIAAHTGEKDKTFYNRCGLVSSDLNECLMEAVDIQSKQAMVKTKIEDSNFTVSCPINSPLAMYFSLRHLKIYLDFLPPLRAANPRIIKIALERENRTYNLFFSWVMIDRARNRIKKFMEQKRQKHTTRYLEQQCKNIALIQNDVVLKRKRTSEETECLAKAMNLPEDFTQEQLMSAIRNMETYKPEIPSFQVDYNTKYDQEGNELNKEQRKLLSTFTNTMTYVPVDGKRRSVRKRSYVP
uniref:C2H2-type domain-containing protein n=1 Tax=Caenorhabditis tropicalis TaxID=1561998 RepID=A0A1I7U0H6_9PELO